MQQRHLRSEGGEHLPHHRGRETDLRDQQQRRLACIQSALHCGNVNRRLARSGNAIEQHGFEPALRHRRCNRRERLHLRLVEFVLVS